ncbi:MAG: hypothetical protein WCO17_13395 [Betaproteobacteria bacterium]
MFSVIYQSNQKSFQTGGLPGFLAAEGGRFGQAVDNFFPEKIFNDFNAQPPKSMKSAVFIGFLQRRAPFECPTLVLG